MFNDDCRPYRRPPRPPPPHWNERQGRRGLSHRSNPVAEPEQASPVARPGPPYDQHGENGGFDLERELELDQDDGQGSDKGGRGGIANSEESFDGGDGGGGGDGGYESDESGAVSGRYVSSPVSPPRKRSAGAGASGGGGDGEISFTPAFSSGGNNLAADNGWTIGEEGSDYSGGGYYGDSRGGGGDDDGGGWRETRATTTGGGYDRSSGAVLHRSGSGAIYIGGGGGNSNSDRGGGGGGGCGSSGCFVVTTELRDDGGSRHGGDFALGKSLDDPFQGFNVDTVHRHAEARNVRSAKKGLGRGGSSGSLAGKDGGGGGGGGFGGGGGGGGRKGSRSTGSFKISSSSGGGGGRTSSGRTNSSSSSGLAGGGGGGGGGRKGGRGVGHGRSAAHGLRFDGGMAGESERTWRRPRPRPRARRARLSPVSEHGALHHKDNRLETKEGTNGLASAVHLQSTAPVPSRAPRTPLAAEALLGPCFCGFLSLCVFFSLSPP